MLSVRGEEVTPAAEDSWSHPGLRVERTWAFLPGRIPWIERLRRRGGESLGSEGEPDAHAGVSSSLYLALQRIKDVLIVPDENVGWFPFAIATGLRMIAEERPEVILATAPPYSSLLVGNALAGITRRPWVADLRDPWTQDPFARPRLPVRERFERWLEGHLLCSARFVLVTTDSLANRLSSDHPDLDRRNIITIRHGFDPPLVENAAYRRNERFTITHTGTFYAKRSPVPFLGGLRKFLDTSRLDPTTVRARFMGGFDPENGRRTVSALRELGLGGVVELMGRKSHEESVRQMIRSEALLYVLATEAEGDLIVPAKTWEYIASGRPILALVPENTEATAILKRFGRGPLVSPPDDVEGVARALSRLYERWLRDDLASDPPGPEFDEFSVPGQVARLAEVLRAIG